MQKSIIIDKSFRGVFWRNMMTMPQITEDIFKNSLCLTSVHRGNNGIHLTLKSPIIMGT